MKRWQQVASAEVYIDTLREATQLTIKSHHGDEIYTKNKKALNR